MYSKVALIERSLMFSSRSREGVYGNVGSVNFDWRIIFSKYIMYYIFILQIIIANITEKAQKTRKLGKIDDLINSV